MFLKIISRKQVYFIWLVRQFFKNQFELTQKNYFHPEADLNCDPKNFSDHILCLLWENFSFSDKDINSSQIKKVLCNKNNFFVASVSIAGFKKTISLLQVDSEGSKKKCSFYSQKEILFLVAKGFMYFILL